MHRRATWLYLLGWVAGGMPLACGGSTPNSGTPTPAPTATPTATPVPDAGRNYRVLHHFTGGANDGAGPLGTLVQSGATLYGMTTNGGASDLGTVFSIGTDGTGFRLLHGFVSPASDGQRPYGTLLLSEGRLLGMAGAENSANAGTLFRVGTDGAGFEVLHAFSGSDGRWPYDSVIQSGSTLYGMTVSGGSGNVGSCGGGVVFRIETDGRDYRVLHEFACGSNDGGWAPGNLILVDSVLYGMTYAGGRSGLGTIFSVRADGSDFRLLHSFAGGANDGANTHGSLTRIGSNLYGMTRNGGPTDNGIVFTIRTDGAGFQILHAFSGGAADGARPMAGELVSSGTSLYGMTDSGGASDAGVVFDIGADGSGFRLLHTFTGADGRNPFDSVLVTGRTLYGMTGAGGSQGRGVIFALDME